MGLKYHKIRDSSSQRKTVIRREQLLSYYLESHLIDALGTYIDYNLSS